MTNQTSMDIIIANEHCGIDIVDRLRFRAPFRTAMVKPELREDYQLAKDAANIIVDLRNQISALERKLLK